MYDKHPHLQGGFIWDWVDQGLINTAKAPSGSSLLPCQPLMRKSRVYLSTPFCVCLSVCLSGCVSDSVAVGRFVSVCDCVCLDHYVPPLLPGAHPASTSPSYITQQPWTQTKWMESNRTACVHVGGL